MLLEVRAAGVGNWNEFVRTGGWDVGAGEQLLVHGAGGVTGGLLVTLAMLRGAQVIATAGRHRLGELVTGARRMRAPAAFTSDPTIQPAYRAHNGLNRADH